MRWNSLGSTPCIAPNGQAVAERAADARTEAVDVSDCTRRRSHEWAAARVGRRLDASKDTDYGLQEGRDVDPVGSVIRFGSPLPGSLKTADGSMLLAADDPLAVGRQLGFAPRRE
jgi:hypothetical protein